jgi:hypothetical protein
MAVDIDTEHGDAKKLAWHLRWWQTKAWWQALSIKPANRRRRGRRPTLVGVAAAVSVLRKDWLIDLGFPSGLPGNLNEITPEPKALVGGKGARRSVR